MKKAVLLFLAVLVVSIVASGCSGNNSSNTSKTSNTTNQNATEPSASNQAPVELSILSGGDTWNPDNAFLPLIEKATHTKLNMQIVPPDQYAEKRNVIMASGKAPNVIRINYQDPLYAQYVSEGMLIPLDEYLDQHPVIKNRYSPEVWDQNRANDGKIYHIPLISGSVSPNLFMFRKDVLEELNLAVPTTTDELRKVFESLKNRNPEKGYTPFVGNRNDLTDLDPFFMAFGTGRDIWQQAEDGSDKLVFSPTTENFKSAIAFIRDLRKDGLFEQEWFVGKNRGIDKFYTGKSEFTMDPPQFIEYRIPEVQKVDKDAAIDYIPVFKSTDGNEYGAIITVNSQGSGSAIVKGTTPEQINAYLDLLTWFDDGEGYNMLKYGVEGKTYEVVDGKIVSQPREQNPPEYDMENMDRFDFADPPKIFDFTRDNVPVSVSDGQFEIAKQAIEASVKAPIYNYASNMNDEVISKNLSTLQSLSEELITKVILNPNSDVDKLFEEYNQKFKQNRLDEVTEAVNRLNAIE